jgi:hypothetical protein
LLWLLSVRAERTLIETLAALRGHTLEEALGERFANPPREFLPSVDENGQPTGWVTLGPPEPGHDAWGRLIPVEPDEV